MPATAFGATSGKLTLTTTSDGQPASTRRPISSAACRAATAQRTGLGLRLLTALEGVARDAGLPMLYLETCIHEAAAIGLYEKAGFRRCGPFGDYPENPYSVFMEKRLD